MENKQDIKQERIEARIDSYTGYAMGEEMIAMIALNSRHTVQEWKANKFITEFSESLGFKKHIDTAVRVLGYLYPDNRVYWPVQDKRYEKIVKNLAWIKYNLKNGGVKWKRI